MPETNEDKLRYAYESHDQIVKAWQAGEYDHDYFAYERDIRSCEEQIARLEKKTVAA